MKFNHTTLLAAGAIALSATAAQAATYDAFTSFNGTQGAGRFYYGDLISPAQANQYTVNTNCFIDGSVCLQRADNHDVPGATKSTTTSFQYGSVNVPDDRLLLHPADDSSLVYSLFLTPTAGTYTITGSFSVQDVSPSGVDLFFLSAPGNLYPVITTPIGSLSGTSQTFTYTTTLNLAANDVIGFGIGNGGVYYNDSTGFNFTVTSVPEPATWSLMILGFGMVGFAMRRRSATTTVTYA